MDEKRLTMRLTSYWERLRKNKEIPLFSAANGHTVSDVWPYCFIVSVIKKKDAQYKYEYMGEPIQKLYGRDLTGLIVDQKMTQFPGGVIHKRLGDVISQRGYVRDEGHLLNDRGQLIKYRACMLPFGNRKQEVTHILVGLSCRFY